MADVKIIDIDSEQWNMKDQNARDRLTGLETGNKVRNINTSPTAGISMQLITITNVKFLQISFNGFGVNLANGQEILSFTNDFGLDTTFYFLVDGDKVNQTGRVPVTVSVGSDGKVKIFPIVIDNMSPNLGQGALYGRALFKVD